MARKCLTYSGTEGGLVCPFYDRLQLVYADFFGGREIDWGWSPLLALDLQQTLLLVLESLSLLLRLTFETIAHGKPVDAALSLPQRGCAINVPDVSGKPHLCGLLQLPPGA